LRDFELEIGEIAVLASAEKRSGAALASYAGQASHVEGVGRQADFFCSVLSPQHSLLYY
jgi:hypothetical protein